MPIRSLSILLLCPMLVGILWVILARIAPAINTSSISTVASPLLLFLLPSLLVKPNGLEAYSPQAWRALPTIELKGLSLRGLPLVLSLSFLLPLVSLSISQLTEWIWMGLDLSNHSPSTDSVEQNIATLIQRGRLSPLFSILVFCLLPAFCEEIYFRHCLQNTLDACWGERYAYMSIIGTSIVFALLHFSAVGFITRFIISVLLGHIYHQTQSLPLVSVLHACNNLLALLLLQTANYNY